MKKILFTLFAMFIAVASAGANCGSCGTDKPKSEEAAGDHEHQHKKHGDKEDAAKEDKDNTQKKDTETAETDSTST